MSTISSLSCHSSSSSSSSSGSYSNLTKLMNGTVLNPLLERILNGLNPFELASSERVCSKWHTLLRNDNTNFWKTRCLTLNPQAIEEERARLEAEAKLNLEIAKTPLAPVIINLKELARPLLGNLFASPNQQITPYKIASGYLPSLIIKVTSADSERECARLHPQGQCDPKFRGGSWHDRHRYSRVSNFPSHLPLRLFINRDGSFKNNGDRIFLHYDRKFIALICCFEPLPPTDDKLKIGAVNFQQEILGRIRLALEELEARYIDIDTEKAHRGQKIWTNLEQLT